MAAGGFTGRVRRWFGVGMSAAADGGPQPLTFPIVGDRIELRPFTDDDAEAMLGIYGDPITMRWVGHGAVRDVATVRTMLRQYMAHQAIHGFAFWAVIERATGRIIGDAGLARTVSGEVEMGYTLVRDMWGVGLGNEVAALCVHTAFETLRLPKVRALVEPENARSQAVLRRAGFAPGGTTMAFGRMHLVFVRATDVP